MALVVVVMMVLFCTAKAAEGAHKHHNKFPNLAEKKLDDLFKQEKCTIEQTRLRNEIMKKSRCGEPKDEFVELKPQASYLEVTPSAVWVKRCKGLCSYEVSGSNCVAIKKKTEHIPVRIYNSKTQTELCSLHPVEVHEVCGCCAVSEGDCEAPRVYNPRKCTCQCPNMEERRNCLKQRSQHMKWNRYKCSCEPKRRVW